MTSVHAFLLLASIGLAACGGTTPGTSRQFDDAGIGSGGSGGTHGPSGGGGPILDAGSLDGSSLDASHCDGGPVTHVVGSRAPESQAEAGGPALIRRVDGGFVFNTPTDPCVTYARPDCPGGPRSIFGCPTVVGPSGGNVIHPGDPITVTVPITDDGLGAYSCNGLGTDQPLVGGSELFHAVKPAYVEESGQVPASTKSGTLYHFTAVASGSRYTKGTACENDLTRLDFDVTVE